MKNIFILSIIITLSSTTFAQNNDTIPKKSKHHIGSHSGFTTGLGLSYRYWPKKIGFQITGTPIITNQKSIYSAGISLLYLLKDNQKVDLFGYLGNHITNINDTSYPLYNIGLGIGMKIDFLEDLDFSFQAGYGVYNVLSSPRSLPTAEVGLYYHL